MTDTPHPAAPHHLPFFITAPGQTDVLMVVMLIVLLVVVLIIGNLYFKLHALPDRIAHRASRAQVHLVAVLTLLALFTHNNLFWIAALLLAFIQFPDFSSPLNSIARSLEKLARGSEPTTVPTPSLPTSSTEGELSMPPTPSPPVASIEREPPRTIVLGRRSDRPEESLNDA